MAQPDHGRAVNSASYHLPFVASFETGDPRCDWINRIVAFSVGSRLVDGPLNNVFEVPQPRGKGSSTR